MTLTSKTILFFGTDSFSAVSLEALIKEGFTIGAVITKPDSKKGRGRELSASLVKQIAEREGIPVWQPLKVNEIIPFVEELTARIGEPPVGVLVSYGKIIPQSVIDLFSPGIINVHPSLLPLYRGPSPIETAILNGDKQTGVTIMQLSAAMDAGPLYTQTLFSLTGTETTPELEATLAEQGAQQLCDALPAIIRGELQPTPQNDTEASYCHLLQKEDSTLDTSTLTAEQAERRVRAYVSFPKSKTTIAGQPVVITRAHIEDNPDSPLALLCSDGRYLVVDELIGPSGRAMNAPSFINGYLR